MDFVGQHLAERVYQVIIVLFSVVGFFVGYAKQEFSLTFYIWAAGVALACLAAVPDWPFYNRNPVKWRESLAPPESEGEDESDKNK